MKRVFLLFSVFVFTLTAVHRLYASGEESGTAHNGADTASAITDEQDDIFAAIEAGKASAVVCGSCHGADGNSTISQYPKLAGQVPGYIAKQLNLFKTKQRDNAIMVGMVQSLDAQDMRNLDLYFSSLAMSPGYISTDQLDMAKRGEKIYRGGYKPLAVSPCMSCHGPAGHGIPPRFPRISSQHPEYLEQQLLAFKAGQRANDVMGPIAFRMSEQQIKEVALYASGLH